MTDSNNENDLNMREKEYSFSRMLLNIGNMILPPHTWVYV